MEPSQTETLKTLPGDDVRQIMWRYTDRYDLQMLVQSSRAAARGPVARLVAEGGRNSHEWNDKKAELLKAFDEAGITAAFMDTAQGGLIDGPKNFVLSLIAFELCWVDGGACTASLAGNLALSPIHEKGTKEQRDKYLALAAPAKPGENRKTWRGAFVLTEPLPYVGVETGMVSGKIRVAEWKEGKEPLLQVDKRGRFITNIGYANFITAAVTSDDPKFQGSCMVILEDTDPGVFDRGTATKKLVHQLSSTGDPIFNLKIPASRIIGGYTIKDGVIIPKFSHGEIIEAVFHHTRVTVGLMSSAKLLSAIEPVIRYHRNRFRGAEKVEAGTPRYEKGLQLKEDCTHRLIDIWATGEAGASLGFATARLFDELDPLTHFKNADFEKKGISGPRAQMKHLMSLQKNAIEYLDLAKKPGDKRAVELKNDKLVQFVLTDSLANVMCPACKLWNTGYGATMMREAVSLVGGYGITEDCPGFLFSKWVDIQLEATYEGPEAVQRRQMTISMDNEVFLKYMGIWNEELKTIEKQKPGLGCSILSGTLDLWLWTLDFLKTNTDSAGSKLYHSNRQGIVFPLADALCWILATRCLIQDVLELETKGPNSPTVAEGLAGLLNFYFDLSQVQAARCAGEVSKVCSTLVYGYQAPGKAVDEFQKLSASLDASLAGAGLAKDRAAEALNKVMIPEILDYPV